MIMLSKVAFETYLLGFLPIAESFLHELNISTYIILSGARS